MVLYKSVLKKDTSLLQLQLVEDYAMSAGGLIKFLGRDGADENYHTIFVPKNIQYSTYHDLMGKTIEKKEPGRENLKVLLEDVQVKPYNMTI